MYPKIQRVFRDHFDRWRTDHKQPLRVLKAAWSIRACRSSALGGHVLKCPHGHVERAWYNSCRHRSCPLCAHRQVEAWIGKKTATLPNCDYFHVVFTLDHALNELWRFNRAGFAQIFFAAAWGSLKEMLADPKHLGALPGALAAFHSWGQTLWIHPHVHFLVTGGGLTPEGRWKPVLKPYLLPGGALGAKFRGKLRAFCLKALEKDELVVPPHMGRSQLIGRLNRMGRRKVHVRIMPPYRHGRGVVKYLGRYMRGGPVSDRRIRYNGRVVVLHYKDNQDADERDQPKPKTMPLAPEEFLRRWVEHVPPQRFHTVRGYGLFAPGRRDWLNAAREQLGQLRYDPDDPEIDPDADDSNFTPKPVAICSVCGEPLIVGKPIPRAQSPPPARSVSA